MEWNVSKNKFEPVHFEMSRLCLQNSKFVMFVNKVQVFSRPGRVNYKIQAFPDNVVTLNIAALFMQLMTINGTYIKLYV